VALSRIKHDRVALLHHAYNAQPLSQCKRVPACTVVQSIANKLVIRHGMTSNLSTAEKVTISFSEKHYELLILVEEKKLCILIDVPTGPASDTLVHLRTIIVDEQSLPITLKKLPLPMWTSNISSVVVLHPWPVLIIHHTYTQLFVCELSF
jgi:hypothetical protein